MDTKCINCDESYKGKVEFSKYYHEGAEAVLEDFLGEVLLGLRTEGRDRVNSQRLGGLLSGKGKSMCN